MPVYRIDLAYDGSGFRGYAANEGVRTVQGELEAALATVIGTPIRTTVAGRTDAGVHARGQVVSFESDAIDPERVLRSLRSMLGPEIVPGAVTAVSDDFDARFAAQSRRYRYSVDDRSTPDPLLRHRVWHVPHPLDVDAMNRAASTFVGEHDFASLCRAADGKTTVRTVLSAGWTRVDHLAVFEVEALAFCHQMVRSMVALCVEVGRGRIDADQVPGILEARDRDAARGAAPPHGLVLEAVTY